ncbi:MAG: BMP family ABC transporter substrate-binding protein [Gammaproteobacteria bacterium]|nr:BMP family ABC transporter substrate-binding protein [Gammaproteobacteria bacterium]MCY4219311.1 BMP family ABC transporter substrate-binding protein [Gammaproteobacteria bacterium]MCY4276017.1 BMP family ABC transporter substrate-binding protein [Gammaproteobacteria bacterium]
MALSFTSINADGHGHGPKVGFIYVGPTGDHGWTYRHDIGRQSLESELSVETTFVESVPEGADAERVIRQLATSGHNLIFTTSFGYMNPTNKVAQQFPDVKFEHATGYKRDSDNVSTYSARFYEGRAVIGTIAGHMSKTGVVGYIASFPIPEVIRGINSFTLAMRKVNPDAVVRVVWVNTWYDPGKEGDAAKALIDQGADIIAQHTDSPAALQVAENRGVYAFGQASDMSQFAPRAHLTSIVNNWDPYYIERTKAVKDGTWESVDTWNGIREGMVSFAPYGDAVPADVRAAADAVKEGISSGSMHPFDGPFNDQAGNQVIGAGEHLDDGVLLGMDYYVEGVEGDLPG